MSNINITLKVWRQTSTDSMGNFESYKMENVNSHMSFLELLDVLNEQLIKALLHLNMIVEKAFVAAVLCQLTVKLTVQ